MKFNKATLIIALMAAGLGFTACDDENEYVPGAPAGKYNVGFDSQENLTLPFAQQELTVKLSRNNSEGELTVPIEALVVPEFMTLPKQATFANGSTTADITIAIGEGMEAFTDYQISFKVPEEYTNAYAADGKSPIFSITVKKEDYKVVANGLYQASVLFNKTAAQVLEYSAMQDLYRMPNWMDYGTAWYFSFDGGDNFTFTNKDGEPVTKFLCGVTHSTYGAIYANVLGGNPIGYEDSEAPDMEGDFFFPLQYTVSAGSFGANYEYLIITQWLEKPWENKAE